MHGTPLFLFSPIKTAIQRIAPTARCKKPPIAIGLRQRRNAKNRRRAVVYVIPRFANNLYNRSSAVDSSFYNQPQVGQPTWGYNYTTVLRRLPSPIVRHPQKRPPPSATIPIAKTRHHHRIAPTARCKKTAEERFNMLARGWLAYPVTSIHSQLPPKSGCRNLFP